MVEHFVRNIGGIGLYGMVSLLLFFAVFVGVLVRACRWGDRTWRLRPVCPWRMLTKGVLLERRRSHE